MSRRTIIYDSVAAEATFDYQVIYITFDKDADGIDDRIGAHLIEKYRPYYKFTLRNGNSDDYRPTDALAFVKQSIRHTNGLQLWSMQLLLVW